MNGITLLGIARINRVLERENRANRRLDRAADVQRMLMYVDLNYHVLQRLGVVPNCSTLALDLVEVLECALGAAKHPWFNERAGSMPRIGLRAELVKALKVSAAAILQNGLDELGDKAHGEEQKLAKKIVDALSESDFERKPDTVIGWRDDYRSAADPSYERYREFYMKHSTDDALKHLTDVAKTWKGLLF